MVTTDTREGVTVAELIAHLQQAPPDTRVIVDGYEGGYDDLHACWATVSLGADAGAAYIGQHRDWSGDPLRGNPAVVVLLTRMGAGERGVCDEIHETEAEARQSTEKVV